MTGNIFDPEYYPFSLTSHSGLFQLILCGIHVTNYDVTFEEFQKLNTFTTTALWDTGSTGCVVTPDVVKQLGLPSVGIRDIQSAGGTYMSNVYLVNIGLPNGLFIPNIEVTECQDSDHDFGFIIGMDVITKGDFALTNYNGITKFSFRIPSKHHIDYFEEHKSIMEKRFRYVGRNDPCPCGSGKKFKNCHQGKL